MAKFGDVVGQQIPSNQRLWDLLIARAKHRFNVYPSPAASHWVHQEYVNAGGQFVKSRKKSDREQINKKKKDGKGRHHHKD
jgi:hypothetical protein